MDGAASGAALATTMVAALGHVKAETSTFSTPWSTVLESLLAVVVDAEILASVAALGGVGDGLVARLFAGTRVDDLVVGVGRFLALGGGGLALAFAVPLVVLVLLG